MNLYDRAFYEMQMAGSARTAHVVIPILLESVHVSSVCDVGCGVGTWLNAFREFGISDLLGIDGGYVDRSLLQIPQSQFAPKDISKPFRIKRKFDVTVCLEVAEHLLPSRADSFVEDLTLLSPIILFSAAIPGQGGVGHFNEQWPSFWARLFERRGFGVCDIVRSRIWDDSELTPCYRQNILIFADRDSMKENSALSEARVGSIDIVHPEFYSRKISADDTKALAKNLWWSLHRDWKRRRRAKS